MKTLSSRFSLFCLCIFIFTSDIFAPPGNIFNQLDTATLFSSSLGERAELIQLEAFFEKSHVMVKWTDHKVEDTQEYLISRSEDGENWLTIAGRKILEEEKGLQEFAMDDSNLSAPYYLYRLKRIGVDGSVSFSNKVKVTVGTQEVIKIYPNPTADHFNVDIPKFSNTVLVELTDISGRQYFRREIGSAATKQTIRIDASKFPQGVYFLSVSSKNYMLAEKIIKR